MEGVAEVLRPLHPGEWPATQLERYWSSQPSSPWPHDIDCLAFALTWVLVRAELNIVLCAELLALLQHHLGSMSAWHQQDEVIGVADYAHEHTPHVAANALLPERCE